MRKILFVLLIGITVFFSGCSAYPLFDRQEDQSSKLCKIEVLSAQDDILLTTIDEQEMVNKFIQPDKWQQIQNLPKDLIPQYKLIVYQEKTLLSGQKPNKKREYEIIEHITTYQDTSYIEEVISPDVIKNMKVPDEFLTLYYIVPDEIISDLQQLLQ